MDYYFYELEYRRSKSRYEVPGLPAEFKDVLIKIPYTSPRCLSNLLLALANQLIKTGFTIKQAQLKMIQKVSK